MSEGRYMAISPGGCIIENFDAVDAIQAVQWLWARHGEDCDYSLYIAVGPEAYEQAKKLQADDTNADTTSREAE